MGNIENKKAKAEWDTNPTSISDGTRVAVQYEIHSRIGKILRRGYGNYRNECRVQEAQDGSDSWVDCWRCKPTSD